MATPAPEQQREIAAPRTQSSGSCSQKTKVLTSAVWGEMRGPGARWLTPKALVAKEQDGNVERLRQVREDTHIAHQAGGQTGKLDTAHRFIFPRPVFTKNTEGSCSGVQGPTSGQMLCFFLLTRSSP